MSVSTLYHIGFFALLAALVYGAVLLNLPPTWIVIGALGINLVGIVVAGSYADESRARDR